MDNFRYPNLSGTPEEQLRQLKSYLYQLVDQLNYQLSLRRETEEKGEHSGKE
ncbi:MAG: hypothetical protein J6Q54_08590 [Oscillospiraceae bacterium]|nr:hypothetical protein [Oscillospiraceae bacterium]